MRLISLLVFATLTGCMLYCGVDYSSSSKDAGIDSGTDSGDAASDAGKDANEQ